MNKKLCRHHGLLKVDEYFCKKCHENLTTQSLQLNKLFNSPKVVNAINEVLESSINPTEKKLGIGVTWNGN